MFIVCKLDFSKGHTYICKVEDVKRGIEIADALMTSRFDEFAVYTEENFEKLMNTHDYMKACMILSEYITGQNGFEKNV